MWVYSTVCVFAAAYDCRVTVVGGYFVVVVVCTVTVPEAELTAAVEACQELKTSSGLDWSTATVVRAALVSIVGVFLNLSKFIALLCR